MKEIKCDGSCDAHTEAGMTPTQYKPHWNTQGAIPGNCNETVYDRWRIDVVGSQCSRKASVQVDGVGFCKTHAKRYLAHAS